jgi:hypothetical protein
LIIKDLITTADFGTLLAKEVWRKDELDDKKKREEID